MSRGSLAQLVGHALAASAGALLASACSSGLEGADPKGTSEARAPAESTNLRFAFDPCLVLTDAITDVEVSGGVIETTTGARERPVAFVTFVTQTAIDDPDDGTVDPNGRADVFVTAIDCGEIDPAAFTYSLAGTMLHARCVTCHQMNVDVARDPGALPPTAFQTQDHFAGGGGAPPLGDLGGAECQDCHFADWKAPGATFDLRGEGTRALFSRAQVAPRGIREHFRNDPRVLWALGSGATPFGGAADDDHDGIDEPEDHDGVRRHAPGGRPAFLERLEAWLATVDPVTGELEYSSAAAAVQDVVLASRAEPPPAAGPRSGDGASSAPSTVYEPNPAFDPQDPTLAPAGFLHVAFESEASDMIGGTANAASDVFLVTLDVLVAADGRIALEYRAGSQLLVSAAAGGGDANGNSRAPDVGADGTRVAFLSEANNLVGGLPVACRPEAYLYDRVLGISLVSHVPNDPLQPGDAGAASPALSLDGQAVCFESDATNLVAGDTNGARDVFYALWPLLDVVRASVTDGSGEFTTHSHAGSIFHDGGDVRVAFATQDAALPPVLGVQCPDVTITLTPSRDGHMESGRPTLTFATGDLGVGTTGAAPSNKGELRTLVAFDLSSIPTGATINSVSLRMEVNMEPGPGGSCTPGGLPNPVTLHVLTADWSEDASWNERMPGVPWGTAGGDFGPGHSSLVLQGLGTKTWSSAQMAADVQSWVDAGANFGWLLDGSNTQCTAKLLTSRESPGGPELIVDLSPPPPSAPALGAGVWSSVFLRDTALGRTFDLNQIVGPDGTRAAQELDVDGTPLAASATNPVLSPRGDAVLFESLAQNLDVVRPSDENRLMDVVLVDLLQLDAQGFLLPYRLSVTPDGGSANGPSHGPRFGVFTPPTDAFPLGLALHATQATNLGDTEPGDLDDDGFPEADNFMLSLLREGGSVIAGFEAEPARQGMGRLVRFESTSSGAPTSFLWDFGDGSRTSKRPSPRHAYAAPGLYTVKLTVSGDRGTDERTRLEYVHVLDAVVAGFTTTKDARHAPLQAPASDVPHTSPVVGAIDDPDPDSRLLFDLDSTGSTEFPDEFSWTLTPVDAAGTPLGRAVEVSEQASPPGVPIAATGLYALTLEATGPGGTGLAAQRLEVYQRVDASFASSPPGTPVRGPASLAVQFTDTSTGDALDAGAHLWDFGDGSSSTEASPAHTFAAGVYFVRLTVSGKGTDSDVSALLPVIADGAITAAFTPAPRPAGSTSVLLMGEAIDDGTGALVDFANLSQHQAGSPLFFRWDFGTGGATGHETVQDPAGIPYVLADPENVQSFTLRLVTSTTSPAPATCAGQPAGSCDERLGVLTLYPRPALAFAHGPSFPSAPQRPPHAVTFTGTVVGDGLGTDPSYRWLRSEANATGASLVFATGIDTTYEFPDPGTYEVVLEVETNGPGGTRQAVRSDPPTLVVVSASTLTEWLAQAVHAPGARCTNCHSGATPPAGLDWVGTPAEIYGRIVEDSLGAPVLSRNCNTSRRRIEPGDPEQSVVYNVLRKPPGPLCPINMRVNLPGDEAARDAHVAVLRSWILDGAPDN